jgi:predicted Zn finger-like uncharacterized protein
MRLVCPNCDAKYEVPDDAIPEGGRDVQCSSCGHAWFQLRPEDEIAAQEETELFGDDLTPAAPEPAAMVTAEEAPREPVQVDQEPDVEPESAADDTPAATEPDDAAAAIAALIGAAPAEAVSPTAAPAPEPHAPAVPARQPLDDSILSVLREEAERETEARRAEVERAEVERAEAQRAGARRADAEGQMQVQPDLGVEAPPASAALSPTQRRLAMLKGEDPDAPPAEPARPAARRDLLPDVEEINSTLQPGETSALDAEVDALPDLTRRSGSFRNGFFLVILILVIAAAVYVMAQQLSSQFPALAGPMDSYVAFIDGLRIWLNDIMNAATARLNGEG